MNIKTPILVAVLTALTATAALADTTIGGGAVIVNKPEEAKPRRQQLFKEHYYCVISDEKFCQVKEQRVGGVCRCANMTGSGRVVVR